jgi:hypothetical protein
MTVAVLLRPRCMKRPSIPCRKCNGTGQIELTGPLAEAFALFRGRQQKDAEAVKAELGLSEITVSAINNRLEDLRRLGLLDRKKKGRVFMYFLRPPAKEAENPV